MAQAVAAPDRAEGVARQAARAPRRGGGGLTSEQWLVLVCVIFGVFISILDSTIVNTAIPKIQAVFGTTVHLGEYIATAYTLAAAVVVGASGYLANRFGIKRVFLTSMALFTIGSALCGLAPNIVILIFFRILQGAGGAALFPLGIALIFAAVPPEQRGLVNGVFGIPVLFAPAIGPTVGGYIVSYIDWRWIFYINVPIGIAGVLVGLRYLPALPALPGVRFDLRGFLLLGAGLGLLLYGTSNLSFDGWGSTTTVSGPIIIAAVLLLSFIAVSLRTPSPLLDLRVFTNRNFWAGNLIIWLATVGLFGAAFFLPQYLQVLRGLDPFHSGLLLLPQGLAAMVATVLAGILYNRVGPIALMVVGAAVLAGDTYFLGNWIGSPTAAFGALAPLLIIRGLALPPLAQTSNTLALQDIRGAALNSASTLIVVTRQVVASLALAVITNIVANQTTVHTANLAVQVSQTNPTAMATISALVARFEAQGMSYAQAYGAAIGQLYGQISTLATSLAFRDAFFLTALITLPAIVLAFLLRPNTSGRVQQAPPGE